MKTAREIAHELLGTCWPVYRSGGDSAHCDKVTDAIDQARREGAEWMREQAATASEQEAHEHGADAAACKTGNAFQAATLAEERELAVASAVDIIRALPVTP